VYVAGYGSGNENDKDRIKGEAQGLMGCADTSSSRINVIGQYSDYTGVCISDRNGCGDCFDGECCASLILRRANPIKFCAQTKTIILLTPLLELSHRTSQPS
jgi:hypothetical protein